MGRRHDLEKILEEGDRLFRDQGYHNTGVEEILSATDFPRSSFYYHFKSKEGFGIKTVTFYGEKMLALMQSHFNDPTVESPLERLQNHFYLLAEFAVNSKFKSLCLIQRFAVDVGGNKNPLQAATWKQFNKWLQAATKCLEEAQIKGEVRKNIPADRIARMLFTVMYGESTLSRLDRENNNFKEALDALFDLIKV